MPEIIPVIADISADVGGAGAAVEGAADTAAAAAGTGAAEAAGAGAAELTGIGAGAAGSEATLVGQGLDLGLGATGANTAEGVTAPLNNVFATTGAAEGNAAPAIAESAAAPTQASAEAGTAETAAGDLYGNETRPLLMQNQPIAAQGEMLPEGNVAGAAKPTAVPAPAPSTGVMSGGETSPLATGPFPTTPSGVTMPEDLSPSQFNESEKLGQLADQGVESRGGTPNYNLQRFQEAVRDDPTISPEAKDIIAPEAPSPKPTPPTDSPKMDPVHLMLMLTAGQTVAGLGSGVLSSLSMSDQIALQKLINSQQQAQIQYENRNNQFAPTVQFAPPPGPKPSGLLSQPMP